VLRLKIEKVTLPLYVIFGIFFVTAPLLGSVNVVYGSNILLLLYLYLINLSSKKIEFVLEFFALVVGLGLLLIIQLTGYEIYVYVLLIKIYFIYKTIANKYISVTSFLDFVNFTFLIFLFASILAYLRIIDLSAFREVNTFEQGRFFSFETLYGFEGSTASIDSYAGFVALCNLLLKDNRNWTMAGIALAALLATTRYTPIVAGIASLIYFAFPVSLVLVTIIIFVTFFSLIIWLMEQDTITKFLFASITSNRTSIWIEQFPVFLERISFKYLFLSKFDNAFKIQVYGHYTVTQNPHNSFLLLLYNSVAGFFVLLTLFIKNITSVKRRDFKAIIFFILIASITNAKILGLGNPIFLIFIIYAIIDSKNEKR
jgi:hypothetical protein